jgi:hypothetical protein
MLQLRTKRTLHTAMHETTNESSESSAKREPNGMDQPRFRNRVPDPDGHIRTKFSVAIERSAQGALLGTAERTHNGDGSNGGFSLHLIRAALIRQMSNKSVYISAHKSMTVRFYTHSITKRAKGVALVDLGATENFMNLGYAKWLWLPIKRLAFECNLYNVDRTENKSGKLKYYTDLEVQMGTKRV